MWKCGREIISVHSGKSVEINSTGGVKAGTTGTSIASADFRRYTSRYTFSVDQDGHLKWRSWRIILELYTARNLTNPHHKLPALATIAQRYSNSTGAEYLAGLWKPHFLQDLMWKHVPSVPVVTVPDQGNPMRNNESRAPSWSWAAVYGSIISEWTDRIPKSTASCEYAWLIEDIE